MSDELEKLAAELKNVRPSKTSRKQGINAAMAAFDAEFAQAGDKKILDSVQGLAVDPRPMDKSPRDGRRHNSGSGIMSKLGQIITFKPQTRWMMGSCAVALVAALVILPNEPELIGIQPVKQVPLGSSDHI